MKKIYFLVFAFCFFNGLSAQIVNIPDLNFKAKLLAASSSNTTALNLEGIFFKIDINNNGEIEQSEALNVATLDVSNCLISSVEGIKSFKNIVTLNCEHNNISSFDVGDLNNLINLDCSFNNLETLNLLGVLVIKNLVCNNNNLSSLNLSSNQLIGQLICNNNSLINLDLRGFDWISEINCNSNKLTSIYINNNSPDSISFSDNPNLALICLDNSEKDDIQALIDLYGYINCVLSTNCSMNNNNVFFPGANFKAKLLKADITNNIAKDANGISIKIDTNGNSEIELSEALLIATLSISNSDIYDLKGINSFENLKKLDCSGNDLVKLELNMLKNLIDLDFSFNKINEITLIAVNNLEYIKGNNNEISELEIPELTKLRSIDLSFNKLVVLIFNEVNNLQVLKCNNNFLQQINFEVLKNINTLELNFNLFDILDLRANTNLTTLECSSNTLLTLDLSTLNKLQKLKCNNNLLISLYLKNGINETTLDFSGNPNLTYICSDNTQVSQILNLINLYGNSKSNIYTDCAPNDIVIIPDSVFKTKLLKANPSSYGDDNDYIVAEDNDGNFIEIDINRNDEIEVSEALLVYKLNLNDDKIQSLEGIKSFKNLVRLWSSFNHITKLDLTGLSYLKVVECDHNKITELNLSGLVQLQKLSCRWNKIVVLDVSGSKKLTYLDCHGDQIQDFKFEGLTDLVHLDCRGVGEPVICGTFLTLDLEEYPNLTYLDCGYRSIGELKFNSLSKLEYLFCDYNKLDTLDFTVLTNLKYFNCDYNKFYDLDILEMKNLQNLSCQRNKLTGLDASNLQFLTDLKCDSNSLNYLLIKNGKRIENLSFDANYGLDYICTDESEIQRVSRLSIDGRGGSCGNVNSYCTFTPGGTYYNIKGKNMFDFDATGCDPTGIAIPNFKIHIEQGIYHGDIISDATANYSITLGAGTYSIAPKLENPNYFNISTSSANVTFPLKDSPFVQDFCISANGIHKDLEINILPIDAARPGFDASYKLVYKNKGNIAQSGIVNLTFDDAFLDIVTANPVVTTQKVNNLSWNFTNLKPFESNEITFTVKVNAPTETPAVNNGDVLVFTANITSTAADETPKDNTFTLNQTVVGSFDPNDKTCLEGTVITPSLIGEYVHYLIRFENTGDYQAQNIVAKDMIDLAKFDISSLIPTSSSHPLVTKISQGNKVEFIFENINLPFDDANNDGYVAFKIKTKSTLKVGDSFDNEANIYFDYNFPILTNKATSKFATTLGTQDFKFSNYFKVYPIPADEVLNIFALQDIEVQSIAVYNILGQMVIAIPNVKDASKIDVSNLNSGKYFVKVKSDKGSASVKFIKK